MRATDQSILKHVFVAVGTCMKVVLEANGGVVVAGDLNVVADDASCLQALSDSAFLSHFDQFYLQERPWRLLCPTPEIVSRLISDVSGRQPPTPSRPKPAARMNASGSTGPSSPPAYRGEGKAVLVISQFSHNLSVSL